MRSVLLLAVLALGTAQAAEVYRWVDRDDVVHYSDQWQPGAEKVQLRSATTYSSPKAGSSAEQTSQPAASATTGYQSLTITSPAQEEVLWNIGGQLRVALQVSPALQPGDRLRLWLDGTEQEIAPGATSTQLTDVFRGVHTLKSQVESESSGAVRIRSEPTTFVVRQTSVPQPGTAPPRP
ncbi:MAG: DUF4124 domain-containing protein [Gammaproteobacteria bacterium]|nr:DUF4124 domain-containing protein [Gammaproteobacteria bacterium]